MDSPLFSCLARAARASVSDQYLPLSIACSHVVRPCIAANFLRRSRTVAQAGVQPENQARGKGLPPPGWRTVTRMACANVEADFALEPPRDCTAHARPSASSPTCSPLLVMCAPENEPSASTCNRLGWHDHRVRRDPWLA